MNEHKDNVPKIRFPGFTDAWEQRRLGELMEISSASRVHKEEWTETGVPFFRSSDVVSAFKGLENDRAFISYELFEELSNKSGKVQENDLLVTGGGSIGIPYKVKNNEPLYFKDADLIWLKNSSSINSDFLYTFLITSVFRRYVGSITHIGTISHYTIEQAKATPIMMPEIEEQKHISQFFAQLDRLITLHQRKLNNVKNLKAGLLQKMFTKNGEDFPEVRFPGFTDAWEQREARDIFYPIVEKGHEKLPVLSVTQESGVVYRAEVGIDIKYDPLTLKNYKVIHPGNFVISLRSFQGGFELSDKLGIASPAYTIFAPKETKEQDNLFWKTQFKTFKFIELLKTITFGIRDGKSINFSEFGNLKLHFPRNKEEQTKIGNFFEQLDHLITLHQRKLEHLQEQKKALLQQMFI